MPNKWTFTIKPIRELLERYNIKQEYWVDPFAGRHSPASLTNDLDYSMDTDFHDDALYFLSKLKNEQFDGALNDPPYSVRQAAECYSNSGFKHMTAHVTTFKYWSDCKDELARVIRKKGKAISFGWNSIGLGNQRGCKIIEILMVCHGGAHNDTIVVVEEKY